MTHGYYIAARGRFGDSTFSSIALLVWRTLHRRAGSKYDGVSIYDVEGRTVVLVTRDRTSIAYRG